MIPAITGTTTCHNNFIIIECISAIPALLDDDNTKPTNKGVITNPNILEILALKIAPGIFPLAIPTITTEEETVEGIAAIKNMPSHKYLLNNTSNHAYLTSILPYHHNNHS